MVISWIYLSLSESEWSRNGFDFEFELDLYIVKKNLICQCNINSWCLAHCWADTAVRLHLNIIFRRSEGGGEGEPLLRHGNTFLDLQIKICPHSHFGLAKTMDSQCHVFQTLVHCPTWNLVHFHLE